MSGTPAPVSIVAPTLREAQNIETLIGDVAATMARARIRWELIVADDDSGDGTDAIVVELAQTLPVRLVTRRGRTPDLSQAVLAGIGKARFERIVVMDADGSHPAGQIPALLAALDAGAKMAIGSRYVPGARIEQRWGAWRKVNSSIATALARPLTRCSDPMSGFFAIERDAVPGGLNPQGYKIALEIMIIGRITPGEVPIVFADRRRGRSKLGWRARTRYLKQLAKLYLGKANAKRLGWFAAAGTCGLAVDIACWSALQAAGLDHRTARVLAFVAAATTTWAANRTVTFADRARTARGAQWTRHLGTGLGALALNAGTYAALTSTSPWFDEHRPIAFALGVALGASVNFVLANRYVFRERLQGHPRLPARAPAPLRNRRPARPSRTKDVRSAIRCNDSNEQSID